MAATVGALRVSLGADTASFEDGMKRAANSLKNFGRDAGAVAVGVQLQKVFEKVGESIADMVKGTFKAIDAMDALGKEAQKIGIPIEQLSSLSLAASLADVSVAELSKSVAKMTKGLAESNTETGGIVRALNALGINVKTFKTLAPEKQLEVLAKEFSKTQDGATKTAIAMALFGDRIGRQMIPLLNAGAAGFAEAREQAEKFNLIIGEKTAKQAENFNDNIKRLQLASQGWFNVLARFLLPKLEELSDRLVKLTLDANGFRTSAENLGRMFLFVWDNASKFSEIVHTIGKILLPFKAGIDTLAAGVAFLITKLLEGADPKLRESYVKMLQDLGLNTSAFTKTVDQLTNSVKPYIEITKNPPKPLITPEQEQEAKRLRDAIADTVLKTKAFHLELMGLAPGFIAAASGMGNLGKAAIAAFEATGKLSPEFVKLNTEMLKLHGTTLLFENLDPIIKMNMELEKTRLAFETIGITSGPILERALDRVKEKFGETWSAIGKNVADFAGSMSSLTKTLGKENKEMILLSKAFGIAQAIINTQIAVTKALAELGPIAGPIAAAAAIAAGAAAVATIVAQGMAKGGSFMVPGAGGTDSKFIPIMATPGERVTVETPEQQKRGGGQTVIQLRGKSFGFEDVRDLFEQINAGMRDGHRFVAVKA